MLPQIIAEVRTKCYDEVIELLHESKENMSIDAPGFRGFGANIPYKQAKVVWPDTTRLHNMSTEGINSSTDKFAKMIHEMKPSLSLVEKKSIVSIDYVHRMAHVTVKQQIPDVFKPMSILQ